MSKAFATNDQLAQSTLGHVGAAYDDDDDEADDETDSDEEDEPSIRRSNQWFAPPGFGSPEWWSGN